MFTKNYLLILIFFLVVQCGYEIVKQKELNQFYIKSFELEGEKRLNHKIKQNILFYAKDANKTAFNIKIKTNKSKSIIEKNIKNEVVKYQIKINLITEIYNFETGKFLTDTFSEQGDFFVGSKNIDTRNNEKKLIEDLTKKISDKILKKLRSI